ncbi:MAG TPA: RsmE family RNA methyltransferase [Polyangiaceae bacterium]|nr:RsmE family RNA methyltransferase [Polyangiaceae bacterium]
MNHSDDPPNERLLLRVWVAPLGKGECVVSEDSGHYLTRVHRLSAGQAFIGFDPEQGTWAEGKIVAVERGKVRCVFLQPKPARSERTSRITLIQGIGKGDKPDRVIRAATELGAFAVYFVRTERSVVSVGERAAGRAERWKAIAIDAARQSGRPDLPALRYSDSLRGALSELNSAALKLLFSPRAEVQLPALLAQQKAAEIWLLVGPEGGFSAQEEQWAMEQGFQLCRLGRHVLRTETAAVAALGALTAILGE